MTSLYLYERQTEYWTSRQIEEFFLDAGFQLVVFPLSQLTEKKIPADFIFLDKQHSKLFGFQYKALHHNGEDYWSINQQQHTTIGKFPWIYYCLSELKSPREHRLALHNCRIMKSKFQFKPKIPSIGDKRPIYSRWSAFYRGLEQCRNGLLVTSQDQLIDVFKSIPDLRASSDREAAGLLDLFLIDFASQSAIHYSPFLANVLD